MYTQIVKYGKEDNCAEPTPEEDLLQLTNLDIIIIIIIDAHRIGLKKGLLKPYLSRTNRKQFYQIEREADFFASCLLMPDARFTKDVYRKPFSIELLDFLKNKSGKHLLFFVTDPNGYMLEFKSFKNHEEVFNLQFNLKKPTMNFMAGYY